MHFFNFYEIIRKVQQFKPIEIQKSINHNIKKQVRKRMSKRDWVQNLRKQLELKKNQNINIYSFNIYFSHNNQKPHEITDSLELVKETVESNKMISMLEIEIVSNILDSRQTQLLANSVACLEIISCLSFKFTNANISDEQANSLSNMFKSLQSLRILNFSFTSNQYSSEQVKIIESGIFSLKNLAQLNIEYSFSNCSEINYEIADVPHLNKLTDLKMSYNFCKISDIGVITFSKYLQYLPSLKNLILDFNNNNISEIGCSYLCDGIKSLQSLRYLYLNLNQTNIKDKGALYIGEVIPQLKELNSLNLQLQKTQIGKDGVSSIMQSIKKIKCYFNINAYFLNNELDADAIFAIAEQLQQIEIERLERIYIDEFNFYSIIKFDKINDIRQLMALNKQPYYFTFLIYQTKLTFDFSTMNYGHQLTTHLGQILKTFNNLHLLKEISLLLKSNNLKCGFEQLIEGIKELRNITHLHIDFSQNSLEQHHIILLLDTLQQLPKLQVLELKLKRNILGSLGGIQIGQKIKQFTNIKILTLNLSHTRMNLNTPLKIKQNILKIKRLTKLTI